MLNNSDISECKAKASCLVFFYCTYTLNKMYGCCFHIQIKQNRLGNIIYYNNILQIFNVVKKQYVNQQDIILV